MATIKDVAKHAGVSTTTVSHVINKTRFVAEDTTKAVWDAVKALNYSPSAVARSLKVNTTKSIGMIITTSESPYFAEVVLAVEEQCYRQGYSLFLCNTQNEPEKIQNHLDMLIKKRVDGILVMCSEYTEKSLALFNGTNVPMVVMDWGVHDGKSDRILDNSVEGGYLATRHLIEKGHKAIGVIAGSLEKTISKLRLEGFTKAMEEANLPINQDWIFDGDFEPEDGFECMNNMFRQKELPTAIFCFSDVQALGAISSITEKGLSVPSDISINQRWCSKQRHAFVAAIKPCACGIGHYGTIQSVGHRLVSDASPRCSELTKAHHFGDALRKRLVGKHPSC